ncbi:ABC transporter permease subunit [Motilibacter aurantiacus]|uniref:ABC transporter permease subunit n=1 Tax=Motilibacter aurantiacus TaxID=2714955 RepID=UPI00140BE042|nr:ABC transporter permease subunit [Motilibacter aurantiacus]NHC47560.1 ABC transporter permease subunit [Motilibacter aurantiacus]
MSAPVAQRPQLPAGGATFGNVLRSEWLKLWSVRSTLWSVVVLVGVTVGLTTLIAWGVAFSWDDTSAENQATFEPVETALAGVTFGQLVAAVIGALIITSEYSTRGIRPTFISVPSRARVVVAKALVLLVVTLVVGLLTSFAAFFVAQLFFADFGGEASPGDPGVLRAVVGAGLYLAGSAMFGLALGTLVRHSAGAITATIALLLVLPGLTGLIPDFLGGEQINKWFVSNAGYAVMDVNPGPDSVGPWTGYLAFTLQWLALLLLGIWLVRRRDA